MTSFTASTNDLTFPSTHCLYFSNFYLSPFPKLVPLKCVQFLCVVVDLLSASNISLVFQAQVSFFLLEEHKEQSLHHQKYLPM